MEVSEARAILGLTADAGSDEARATFRRLLHEAHPDRNDSRDAADRTRAIVLAYRTLGVADTALPVVARDDNGGAGRSQSDTAPQADLVTLLDSDTIGLACPSDEAFAVLLEVAHRIGDVTYLDRDAELLEALLRTVDGTTISMVISLQGRATGVTEAFVTLEPIDRVRGPLPAVSEVAALVAEQARVVINGG